MTDLVIIQTSLNKKSKTANVVEYVSKSLDKRKVSYEIIDLRDYNIEFCDGRDFKDYNIDMQKISKILEKAKVYILAFPVYNYSFSGACKNFVDIFSGFMDSKFIGLINNSGGIRSANEGTGELMKILGRHNNITTIQPVLNTCWFDFDEDFNIKDKRTIETIYLLIHNVLSKIQ